MKRILILVIILFSYGVRVDAQWKIAPRISLEYPNVYVGDSLADGKFSLNPEVFFDYFITEKWAVGIGTGYRRVKTKDYGNMSAVPIFVDLSYGESYGINLDLGYMIPVNSTYTPLLSGPFASFGVFIRSDLDDGDALVLGGELDVFNINKTNKIPTYVPDGYGPIVSGVSLGLSIQYLFPIKR